MTADLVERIRTSPGVRGKAAIGLVTDVFHGTDWTAAPGNDGAAAATNHATDGGGHEPYGERWRRRTGLAANSDGGNWRRWA